MKAAFIESFAPQGNIKVGEIPTPSPKEDEVRISIAYAGVNPVDAKIAEGLFEGRYPHEFPLILGWEAAGTIDEIGKKVTSFNVGDEVYFYCRKPTLQWGSWAEYVTFPAEHVALKPKNLSMAQAASIPLAGLTAWQSLFELAYLKSGETVLIHAGAGGVGGFAIQWAKLHGAKVITTASASKFDYVKQMGADEIIDYQKHDFVKEVRKSHPDGIDVAFDTVGKAVYQKSFEVLKPGGRIVSILEQPNEDLAKQFQVRAEFLFVHPDKEHLQEMGQLFESGKAQLPKIQEFSLDQASLAIEEIRKGHTVGKIVLKI